MKLNLSESYVMRKEDRSYKIIIDSNIWISFLIGKAMKELQNNIDSHVIITITCTEQILELSEVFRKPKIKKYFSKDQITEFFDLLNDSSLKIKINTKTNLCRDSKDDYLVSLALDSNADFLITGDKDLLELNNVGGTIILNYTDFEKIVKL